MSLTSDDYGIPAGWFIRAHHRLRSIVQQEIRLMKNSQRSKEIPTLGIQKSKNQNLNKEYWLFSQKLWQAQSAFERGPVTRAIDLWHSHPRWYMHKFLVQDCAGKGGCCGRDCGCCVDRPIAQSRKLGVGHCTTECGCCAEYRGFDLTEEEKRNVEERFDISEACPSKNYPCLVAGVLFFGTLEAENTNPFDMIYEPTWRGYKAPQRTRDKCALVTSRTPCKPLGDTMTGLQEHLDTELCTGEIIDLSDGGRT